MPLRSEEPPERPPALTDLIHSNLICICHRPSFKLARRTHAVHVLAFGTSRNSISPLSSLLRELSGFSLPLLLSIIALRSRAFYRATVPTYARRRLSLPLFVFSLSPRAFTPLSRRLLVSSARVLTGSRLVSRPTSQRNRVQYQSYLTPYRATALPHIRVDSYLRAYNASVTAKPNLLNLSALRI